MRQNHSDILLFLVLAVQAQGFEEDPMNFDYGEPTVFVINKLKNKTAGGENQWESSDGKPVMKFELNHNPITTVVILAALLSVILCTVFGNILVVAAVFLERNLQRLSNYLIVSLAVADLMVATLVMPISSIDALSRKWYLGVRLCDFWIMMDVLCCTASILHLVAIAVDRYWAVTHADYSQRNSKKIIFSMILAVWFTATIISVPSRFTLNERAHLIDQVGREYLCKINTNLVFQSFATLGAFFLPMTFLLCIYLSTYASARKRIRRQHFNWPAHSASLNNVTKARDSVLTLSELATISVMPPSPINHTANGSIPQQSDPLSFMTDPESPWYCFKDACLSRPTIWVDNDGELVSENISYSALPRPTEDGPPIKSPFLPQTPLPSSHCAFKFGDSQISCTNTTPPPPTHTPTATPIPPPTMAQTKPNDSSKSGRRKFKRVLDLSFGSALSSAEQRRQKKESSTTAREAVLARKERLEHRRERRAARTLAIITGGFLLCWLPFSINALLEPFCGEACNFNIVVQRFFLWLGYVNSMLNPIIYNIFSPDFRKAFVKILSCKYCRRRC